MDFDWSPELRALRAQAEEVAAKAIATYGQFDDAWINGYSREFSRELGRLGWIGMTWPVEYGGGGRSPLERFVVTEALIEAGAPIAASWFADRQMGPTLIAFGTEDQKRRFLPGILNGETGWCIGMSEPGAGSDLASLTTRAVRDGDHYVITGQKIWTSFGETADYCYLICRTSSDGPKHTGISEIIVPLDSPGVTIRPIEDMTTNRHFCEVFFDEVRVPAENLVGVEGESFKQTMRQLEHERGGIDRLVSNRALYLDARDRADLSDPRVRQEVARLETGYRLGRLLVLRETLGQAPRSFSAATKTFCTEHEQRVAAFAARTFGADATLWGRTARSICYAPAYTIMGGTSNVLRNIIGERVLGLPREPSWS
jgi:alkylation response protein AidB-like acyl-CoA dehydrogenase